MRTNFFAMMAVAGLAVFGAGAAQAQVDQSERGHDPAYCVYDALIKTFDYEVVAEAFLLDDITEAEDKAATDLVAKVAGECAKQHGLSASQVASMSDIGIYGSAADYLSDELMFSGVSDEAIDGIYGVVDGLSDDEFDKLYEDNWRSDLAFSNKLKSALIGKGIPENDFAIETSFQIIQIAVVALDTVALFTVTNDDKAS